MKIRARTGNDELATVFIAENKSGKLIEFSESVQPPLPRSKKWVLTVSTLFGCPVGCAFCDAGINYHGKLSAEEITEQIDFMILNRFGELVVPVEKFKIQFARMGEPAFNSSVLDVLKELPNRYDAPGLIPSVSSIAPCGTDKFFEKLLDISKIYQSDKFQLQFSIHTTDVEARDALIPVKKWNFSKIASYGEKFYRDGGRKITLNFAIAEGSLVDPHVLLKYFDPLKFLVKITPINPTFQAMKNKINSLITPNNNGYAIIGALEDIGYDVILSIGDIGENLIGSNCGQHVMNFIEGGNPSLGSYTFPVEEFIETHKTDSPSPAT